MANNENDISGKVGLDITEFKTGVTQLNREIRVIESGFKAAAAGTDDWTKNADTLKARIDSLTKIIELQQKKVDATREAYEAVAREQGESSKAAQDLAIKLNRETEALNKNEKQLREVTTALDRMGDESKTAEQKAEDLSKAMEDLGTRAKRGAEIAKAAVKAAGVAAAAAAAAVMAFAKQGLDLASDLEEVQNVVDVTFGEQGSKMIDSWAKDAAKSFGMSELQAKQFNGTMGAMLKSMGLSEDQVLDMSQSIAGLSGDFASFYNLDSEEAFAKIRAGISGETEPLKQLGINMSVANLEAYALSQGITESYNSMTQAEQALLRYNYLMTTSADAQGDFARTSDSYANQQRIFALEVDNLAASFGSKLLPAATDAIGILIDGITQIDPAVFDTLVAQLSAMAVSLAEAAVNAIPKVIEFVSFMMDNGPTILSVIAGIGAGMIAWNVVGMIQSLIGVIKAWQAANVGLTAAQKILNLVLAANPIGIVITVIAALVAAIVVLWNTNEGFRKAVTEAWNNIKTSVTDAIQAVKDTIGQWKKIGEDIIDGIKEGIKAAAKRLVDAAKNAVQGALNAAKNVLGIKSPSKVFRDQVGAMIGMGIAEGINDSSAGVNSAMGRLNKQLVADATVRFSTAGKAAGQAPEAIKEAAKAGSVMNVTINVRSAADAIRELNVLNKQLASTI